MAERIDALFADCARGGHPGVAVGVVRGGEVVHRRAHGLADIEAGAPLTPRSLLHLGSTTKHFCAACLLILEDRGQLSLDDPVRRHVPELPVFAEAISLRALVTMTSGLPDGLNFAYFAGLAPDGLEAATHLDLLARLEAPMFAPGTGTTYSNSNYFLASLAVERVAGTSLAEFMQRELFAPLGMAATGLIADPAPALDHKARGYVIDAAGRAIGQSPMRNLCGDGGIVTSLDDFLAWARRYAADDMPVRDFAPGWRPRPGSTTVRPPATPWAWASSRALGRRKVAHGGGMPGFLADFAYWPDEDLAVVWLSNWMDPKLFEITDQIAAIILGEDLAPPATGGDADLARLAGLYGNFSLGCTAQFDTADGAAVMHMMGERLTLERTGPGAYRPTKTSAWFPLRITDRVHDGRPVVEMRIGESRWSEFLPIAEVAADDIDLAPYAGAYHSDLLGETHWVEIVDGALEARLASALRKLLWRRLRPRGRTCSAPSSPAMTAIPTSRCCSGATAPGPSPASPTTSRAPAASCSAAWSVGRDGGGEARRGPGLPGGAADGLGRRTPRPHRQRSVPLAGGRGDRRGRRLGRRAASAERRLFRHRDAAGGDPALAGKVPRRALRLSRHRHRGAAVHA